MPYFDHNATTPLFPVAREAWLAAADEAWQNPSSPYRSSARVHRLLADARARLAAIVGGTPESIVFTGGATEANNALFAWAARSLPENATVVFSPAEHPSILEPVKILFGARARSVRLSSAGTVNLSELETYLEEERVGIVAAMGANNETGVLNPLEEVALLCRKHGAMLLADCSQWIGKVPASGLPRDAILVGCAHKFGGPKGTAFIRLPTGAEGFAGARGGSQENDHRAGTEDFPDIAAMVAALEFCESFSDDDRLGRASWRDQAAATIIAAIAGASVVGADALRLWNTLSLTMPKHENIRWVTRLDRSDFQVSTGSACASGSSHPSHVLAAMGASSDEARRTIRISGGWETTESDWQKLAAAVVKTWDELEKDEADSSGSSVIKI